VVFKSNISLPKQASDMPFSQPLIVLDSVDSTNNYAMGKVRAGEAGHGSGFAALEQTQGKGQWGRSWQTGKGLNIALSLVIEPHTLRTHQQFQLSVAVALGAADFLTSYLGSEISVKWPNDLYWCDRKAGGILIENVIGQQKGSSAELPVSSSAAWKFAVAGIGINVNQTAFPADLPHAVSMRQVSGIQYHVPDLLEVLYRQVMTRLHQLELSGFQTLLDDYNYALYRRSQPVTLRKNGITFETVVDRVNAEGQLLTNDWVTHQFNYGEVEWLLPNRTA
jgi:BirA family biotin operon repressor/biotin-[acetyl-CoA-carboxylase] ligase